MPNGSFIAQFGLKLKDNSVRPISNVIPESVRIEEVINQASVWTFTLDSTQFRAFNESFWAVMQNPTPNVSVRLGTNSGGAVTWEPWQDHIITRLRATPRLDSHTILVQTSDFFAELDRETKTRAWQGEISSIVGLMSKNRGVESLIEPTVGQYSLVQSFCSDYDFLQRLASRAVTKDGRCNFRFYFLDGKLHFHTPSYQSKSVRKLNGFRAPVSSALLSDDTQLQVHYGAAGAKLYTFSPLEGSIGISISEESKQKMAKSVPPLGKIPGGSINMGFAIGQNVTEASAITQAIYEQARSSNYAVLLKTEALICHIDEIIDIDLTQSTAQTNPWSGRYMVNSLVHNVKQGMLSSSVTLVRGDIN